jgi:hypothetical protein
MDKIDLVLLGELTKIWAMENRCHRNEQGQVGNTFTIAENTTNKPVWVDQFPDAKFMWVAMWHQAIDNHIFIAYENFKGWYIGTPEEVGMTIAFKLKGYNTRQQTLLTDACYAVLCGQSDRLLNGFRSKTTDFSLEQFINAEREKQRLLGQPFQEHLVSMILRLKDGNS